MSRMSTCSNPSTYACILFNNQFTTDEVYDNYPADRLMHDIALALLDADSREAEIKTFTDHLRRIIQYAEQQAGGGTQPS